MKPKGMICLVGAGPGDPGLLTLRAAELLERADVVVYDALVNPEVLRLAAKSPELIGGAKAGAELNHLLIAKARAGKTVVRLIGGDPYFFGGGGEEAEQLADAGVPFEVVPGVSSLMAAPTFAGVPLTHREFASQLTLLAAPPDASNAPSDTDRSEENTSELQSPC